MSNVILISGKMGSGKTTLAWALKKKFEEAKSHHCLLINFADALYEMHDYCLDYLQTHGVFKGPRPRKDGALLQMLGTDWGRKKIGENVWVDILKARVQRAAESLPFGSKAMFVVADCRFPNELDAFPDALKVRLECDRDTRKARCDSWRDNENHDSEIGLDDFPGRFHFIFDTGRMPVDECVRLVLGNK
jgi:broad-specificity NMP kinase